MLYYWPGKNKQIRELAESCTICENFKRNLQKEPLIQEQTPKNPFPFRSDAYETADSDCYETESDNEIVLPTNDFIRSGRIVKPPSRYGWN